MAYSPSIGWTDDVFYQTSPIPQRVDLLARLKKLTLDDKELLKQCWHHLAKHKDDIAVDIFVLLIKQCPEAKKLFYFTDDDISTTSSKRLKADCALQFHALRFLQIIESMVDTIDEPTALEPVLINLGQIHIRIRDKCGFQPFYWSIFFECVLFVFRERLKHRTDDIDRAISLWRTIVGAIKQKMKHGFYEGDRVRRELLQNNVSQSISMIFPNGARRSMRPSVGWSATTPSTSRGPKETFL